MSEAINAPGNSSDVGSPMGGAIDPGTARRISELGTNAQVPGKLQPLDGWTPPRADGDVQPFAAPQAEPGEMIDLEQVEAQEAQPAEPQVEEPPQATPEAELAAKYQELLDSPELPMDLMGDKVIWYDSNGKGEMIPIRLKDVPQNILMYNDYQRKTTEVAERNRALDRKENGMKQLAIDLQSEDPQVGLRALRAMGASKSFKSMVISYINEMATLEKLPPPLQQKFLAQQQVEDENFYLKRRAERMEQQQQELQRQQLQEQGTAAPAVKFIQDAITQALPETYKSLGISDAESSSPAFIRELDQVFEEATAGERNPDGTWRTAPTIQLGRVPSKQLITQLVQHAKQRVDKLFANPSVKRLQPPKRTAPPTLTGTGPAPGQGQRGNLAAPQRMRWSDMDRRRG